MNALFWITIAIVICVFLTWGAYYFTGGRK